MSYGLTKADLPIVRTPKLLHNALGVTVQQCALLNQSYELLRLQFEEGKALPTQFYLKRKGTYYVEDGSILISCRLNDGSLVSYELPQGHLFHVKPGLVHQLGALTESTVYLFSDYQQNDSPLLIETIQEAEKTFQNIIATSGVIPIAPEKTFDVREKYWGRIESIIAAEFAGKMIVMRKGTQSSLEFHCHKYESYYLHSGQLKIGLRAGRSENTSVVLNPGECFDVIPGLMHMRIALKDSVLIEISTKDDDSDSHIVEDGNLYQHREKD